MGAANRPTDIANAEAKSALRELTWSGIKAIADVVPSVVLTIARNDAGITCRVLKTVRRELFANDNILINSQVLTRPKLG